MKTAWELFNTKCDWAEKYLKKCVISRENFTEALVEHDNEIKAMIDEMIEEEKLKLSLSEHRQEKTFFRGRISALTELKQFIEEKK